MSLPDSPDRSLPPLVDDAIVITGPTAAGKSTIAIALAEKLTAADRPAEILSLDSIAVYRDMNIGTAKPSIADQRRVPHYLIDLVDPTEEFSVARYLQAAHEVVNQLRGAATIPIFVGGTPMFLKGILRGFDPGPPADWEFRNSVETDLQKFGVAALYERLRQVDPLAAHKIDPADSRRMIRALEVAYQTGQPISHRQLQFDRGRDPQRCNVFWLDWPRAQLHQRINTRVDQMFADGLVAEVADLVRKYRQLSRTASQAVGYREIIEASSQQEDLCETKETIAAHTRQMARRQETWLRSLGETRRVSMDADFDAGVVAEQIIGMLV